MKSKWVITGTRNCNEFLHEGSEILLNNGSAIDAVEEVIKKVESNPNDFSVGYNGFPNLIGEVELDASIMVGSNRKAGCVAGIKYYIHAISIARTIMELSPHVLLVGSGAERFAQAIGFEKQPLLDNAVQNMYNNVIAGKAFLDGLIIPQQLKDLAWRYDKNITRQLKSFDYLEWYRKLSEKFHGTVNVIALDSHGELCSGVSTSGLALKFPGRVGDSPLIGAGNYCDIRYGAATCVGVGELAIRLGLSRETVSFLRDLTVEESVFKAISEVIYLNEKGTIQILAMDRNGNVSACSNSKSTFVYADAENPKVQQLESQFNEIKPDQN